MLWKAALDEADAALTKLRDMYPSRMYLMPESGYNAIHRALSSQETVISELHRSGRYLLGQEPYDIFIADRLHDRPIDDVVRDRYRST